MCERDEALAALKPQIAQVIKPYKLEQNDLQEPHFFPCLRQIYQVCENKMMEDCTYQELLNAGVRIAVRKSPNTYVLQPEFHVFCKQHLEGEIIPTKGYSDFQNRIGCCAQITKHVCSRTRVSRILQTTPGRRNNTNKKKKSGVFTHRLFRFSKQNRV